MPVFSNSEVRPLHAYVGTCGFAERQARTFREFDILEVQQTFYQPPKAATVRRWREKAPAGSVFTLKAWQLLTHECSSPTYRRLREGFSDAELAQAGSFKWNRLTRMAWERTLETAEALEAQAVVFQAPRTFTPSSRNLRRLYRFFERIERGGRRMAFEPRGEAWDDATLRSIVSDLDLIHVVDPFLRRPVGRGQRYFRLHGRPAYHYHYRYTEADLATLLRALAKSWPDWVLFNNDAMADDARRFIRHLRRS